MIPLSHAIDLGAKRMIPVFLDGVYKTVVMLVNEVLVNDITSGNRPDCIITNVTLNFDPV